MTDEDSNTSRVTIDGQQYWLVTGLTGTGGLSIISQSDNNDDQESDGDNNQSDNKRMQFNIASV